MLKKTLKLGITVAALSCLGLGTVAVTSMLNKNQELSVNAGSTPTNYRIYLINECDDWSSSAIYAHYWGGSSSSTWGSDPAMTKVVSDWSHGIWYYDIPFDTTGILFKTGAGNIPVLNETVDLLLSSYSSQTYVFYVKNDADPSSGKRWWDKMTTAGCNNGQLAAILGKLQVCEADYSFGYYAWPQVNKLFVRPSTYDGTYSFTNINGSVTTLADTVSTLSSLYSAHVA
jgi:hypothetical protein